MKSKLLRTTAILLVAGVGVAGAAYVGVKTGVVPASWVAACFPCSPGNPCNPCAAANPCNPCAVANPCNPYAAANPCNPCAAQ